MGLIRLNELTSEGISIQSTAIYYGLINIYAQYKIC